MPEMFRDPCRDPLPGPLVQRGPFGLLLSLGGGVGDVADQFRVGVDDRAPAEFAGDRGPVLPELTAELREGDSFPFRMESPDERLHPDPVPISEVFSPAGFFDIVIVLHGIPFV